MAKIIKVQNSGVLVHHGIKGQRWGVRRYQNEDGSPTAAGKKRQGEQAADAEFKAAKQKHRDATADRRKRIGKAVAIGSGAVLGTAAVTAAAVAGGKFLEKQLGKMMINAVFDSMAKSLIDIDNMSTDIFRGR